MDKVNKTAESVEAILKANNCYITVFEGVIMVETQEGSSVRAVNISSGPSILESFE